jgi:hypothetical protein
MIPASWNTSAEKAMFNWLADSGVAIQPAMAKPRLTAVRTAITASGTVQTRLAS